jgi:hypothetical protein
MKRQMPFRINEEFVIRCKTYSGCLWQESLTPPFHPVIVACNMGFICEPLQILGSYPLGSKQTMKKLTLQVFKSSENAGCRIGT